MGDSEQPPPPPPLLTTTGVLPLPEQIARLTFVFLPIRAPVKKGRQAETKFELASKKRTLFLEGSKKTTKKCHNLLNVCLT